MCWAGSVSYTHLDVYKRQHLGHAALLRRTVEEAARRGVTPAVFTFDRPPKEVLTGTPCPLINSPEDRKDLVRRLFGIREVLMLSLIHI